jgi:hypothetical protein
MMQLVLIILTKKKRNDPLLRIVRTVAQCSQTSLGETCWGLSTHFGGNKLSFPTPMQTHIFDNQSNGYGRFKNNIHA